MTKQLIYILDDDSEVRDSLVALLNSQKFRTASFERADDFLIATKERPPACAIVDVRMPGVSGLELLAIMRQRQMSVPVVIITGHGDVATAVQSMKLGAVDVLQKPFPLEALLGAISSATGAPPTTTRVPAVIEHRDVDSDVRAKWETLSPREREILNLILTGASSKEIGETLGISTATVNNHRTQIKTKMNAKTVAHLLTMVSTLKSVA
jgi:two-component system, LuxR family, response regulator FixJ